LSVSTASKFGDQVVTPFTSGYSSGFLNVIFGKLYNRVMSFTLKAGSPTVAKSTLPHPERRTGPSSTMETATTAGETVPKGAQWNTLNIRQSNHSLSVAQDPNPSDPVFQENNREFIPTEPTIPTTDMAFSLLPDPFHGLCKRVGDPFAFAAPPRQGNLGALALGLNFISAFNRAPCSFTPLNTPSIASGK
jgi:hypothetical protein